jgi:penicillin-binding protein 2
MKLSIGRKSSSNRFLWIGILAVLGIGGTIVVLILRSGNGQIPGGATRTPPSLSVEITRTSTPESIVRAFLNGWQAEDYSGMYSLLSPIATRALPQDQFEKVYTNVRNEATLRSLDYTILSVEMTPADAAVNIEVALHTALFGDIVRPTRMLLNNVDGPWKVVWDGQTILPELENGNSLILHRDTPTRGNIYDRNGLALATEAEVVEIGVIPGLITDEDAMLSYLSTALQLPREVIRLKYNPDKPDAYYPIGEVSRADLDARHLYETLRDTGGIQLQTSDMRYYYGGGIAANVVGYTRPLPKEMQPDYLPLGYSVDDRVGASGLELGEEQFLAGKHGGTLDVVTSTGAFVSSLAEAKSSPGMDIFTTLDRGLQSQMDRTLMGSFSGAAVVLNRNTGEVLAMVTNPSFDSNWFNPQSYNGTINGGRAVANLLNDPGRPFLNRATQGTYPLGSVFKIVTMAAALESGRYTKDTIYNNDSVFFTEYPGTWEDWTGEKGLPPWGKITLEQGLERSCNNYFWHIGLDLFQNGDPSAVTAMAKQFGLGAPTRIIGLSEDPGLIPGPGDNPNWSGTDALNQAIGQGGMLVTPLQVADFVAAVGNGGTLYRPRVVLTVAPDGGDPVFTSGPEVLNTLPLKPDTLRAIQEAMTGVVNDPLGTARQRFYVISTSLRIAGKTGTAQSGSPDPHAWFASYTFSQLPNKPDIAVVVVVENVGDGSVYAAPMVRRAMEIYFFGAPRIRYAWESEIGVRATDTPVETETPTETPTETVGL